MSKLPEPDIVGKLTVAQALYSRRSCRSYRPNPLSPAQISNILWAGQGQTMPSRGFRTAPSAGATFPLRLYAVLPEGVFRYRHETDPPELVQVQSGDVRRPLAAACLGQYFITTAGLIVIIAANFSRTTSRYGQRGERYVWIETGHAAENMFLQAEALGLGAVAVGAYDDDTVAKIVAMAPNECPALLVVAGVKDKAD